jgi:hypothetical protein
MSTATLTSAGWSGRSSNRVNTSLTLVGRYADCVVIDVGWRQNDTVHGIRGLDDHRRGMASQRHLSRVGTEHDRNMCKAKMQAEPYAGTDGF